MSNFVTRVTQNSSKTVAEIGLNSRCVSSQYCAVTVSFVT